MKRTCYCIGFSASEIKPDVCVCGHKRDAHTADKGFKSYCTAPEDSCDFCGKGQGRDHDDTCPKE